MGWNEDITDGILSAFHPISLIHSGDLYSAFSRDYYSEALPAQSRTKKKDLYIQLYNIKPKIYLFKVGSIPYFRQESGSTVSCKALDSKDVHHWRKPHHGMRDNVSGRDLRRAHHNVAKAGHRSSDLHPVQRISAPRRCRIPGKDTSRRAGLCRDLENWEDRPGMVRVFYCLP